MDILLTDGWLTGGWVGGIMFVLPKSVIKILLVKYYDHKLFIILIKIIIKSKNQLLGIVGSGIPNGFTIDDSSGKVSGVGGGGICVSLLLSMPSAVAIVGGGISPTGKRINLV